MNKLVKGVLGVSIVCIVAGTGLFIAGRLLGGQPGFWMDDTGIHTNREFQEKHSFHLLEMEKEKLDRFQNLDVETDYNDIEIVPSDDSNFYLEYRLYAQSTDPQYQVDQDTLSFQCIQEPVTDMDIGFFIANTDKKQEQGFVRIYIPKDARLETVKLNNSDSRIRYNGPDADTFHITSAYGEIHLEDKKAKTITLTSSDGDILCHSLSCEELALKNQYGETGLENIEAKDVTLEASDGMISIKNLEANSITVTNQYGEVKGDGIRTEAFSLTMSDGECLLKQADLKQTEFENTYGTFEVELTGKENDYNYSILSDYGTIVLGGREWDKNYEKNHGAKRNLTGKLSDGNVIISHAE